MAAVVADTHTLVWHLLDPNRLSLAARAALLAAPAAGEPIYLASISVVEVQYLVEKGKLPSAVLDQLILALDDPTTAFRLVPLDIAVARTLARIPRDEVPDMPDRIIAATALALGVPLVSGDRKIRASTIITIW